jgi:hypothetical protein
MCVTPSLVAIPIYFTIKKITPNNFKIQQLAIVFASAFLPLSLLHLPEFSQKNVLGMLLMAMLMLNTRKSLLSLTPKSGFAFVIFTLIVLTHFGTAGAAILYGASLFMVFSIVQKKTITILKFAGIGLLGLASTLVIIHTLDHQRFDRILYYLTESFGSSFLSLAISSKADTQQRIGAIISILIPILITLFFYSQYRKNQKKLSEQDQLFWPVNIIFFYLLLLPVYDQLLFARFFLFASLPVGFILVYMLTYCNWRKWVKNAVVLMVLFGTVVMMFGEIMSLKMHNRDKEDVYESITMMKNSISLTPNDLIITKNGAEHICNWFLNTKSGMITSLNKADFTTYRTVYILNPIEGELDFKDIEGKKATNETDRYLFMMRNIPAPKNAVLIYESEYLELFELSSAPLEWEYSADGYWISYGN